MDRHDLPGVTAEEVAQAHLTDLQLESKHAVQFLAYWFDADHGQVFWHPSFAFSDPEGPWFAVTQ